VIGTVAVEGLAASSIYMASQFTLWCCLSLCFQLAICLLELYGTSEVCMCK